MTYSPLLIWTPVLIRSHVFALVGHYPWKPKTMVWVCLGGHTGSRHSAIRLTHARYHGLRGVPNW